MAKIDNGCGDEETKSAKERTIEFGLSHPIIALSFGQFKSGSTNITTNAVRFATNDLGLNENSSKERSQVNAFRHVLWQATITKRYGIDIASRLKNFEEASGIKIDFKYDVSGGIIFVDNGKIVFKDISEINPENPSSISYELNDKHLSVYEKDTLIYVEKHDDAFYVIKKAE